MPSSWKCSRRCWRERWSLFIRQRFGKGEAEYVLYWIWVLNFCFNMKRSILSRVFFLFLFFFSPHLYQKVLWGISSFSKKSKAQWDSQHVPGLIHAVIHDLVNTNCNQSMRLSHWLMKLMVSFWLMLTEAVGFIYIYPTTKLMNHRSQLHCYYMLNKNMLLTGQTEECKGWLLFTTHLFLKNSQGTWRAVNWPASSLQQIFFLINGTWK